MAAAGLWLLGSAPAFAACATGTQGTQLAAGQCAVKIEGFVTDTSTCGTSCPDPTPASENCFGVISSDGACDITGGDLLCSNPTSGITGPATNAGLKVFSGTSSPANDVGTYFFNSNNTGEIVISDTPSGKVYAFGIVAGLGNAQMQGASIFGSPGVQKDPLIITIQKRDQTITAAQFLSQDNAAFDPAGGSAGGSGLGKGFDAVALGVEEHLDPETNTTPEGGGSIFFNVDGGYDSDIAPGIQLFPSSLIVDFHEAILAQHLGDGTQEASATLNGDYSNPLAGASFQTASVLFGTTNQNAWTATVGSAGVPSAGLAIATAYKSILVGNDQGQAALLISSPSNLHPTKTVTITNGSIEPLDWTAISIQGVPDVTITGGTCSAVGGDLAAWNPVGSVAKPTCTIIFTNSGTTCTTGSPEVGTYRLDGADHVAISGTPTAAGVTFSLKCQ